MNYQGLRKPDTNVHVKSVNHNIGTIHRMRPTRRHAKLGNAIKLQAVQENEAVSTSQPDQPDTSVVLPTASKRIAVFKAQRKSSVPVKEQGRSLAEYMTLPASQYSVLDAKKIERLDADTFRCQVDGLQFFSFRVEPVLTLSVIVGERGPTVRLLSTTLQGSKIVQQANERFTATMTNIVEWQESASGGLEITSDATIQVTLQVPKWFVVPTRAIEKTGCSVMEKVLQTAMPRFLEQLRADYGLWAAGSDERQPIVVD